MKLRLPGGRTSLSFTSPSHTRVSADNINTNSLNQQSSSTPLSCLRRKSSSLFESPRKVLKKKIVRRDGRQDNNSKTLPRNRDNCERDTSSRYCFDDIKSRMNALKWIHDDAPRDIVPKIMSFLGSRKVAVLSRTCRSWRELCLDDAIWRTISEDTRKWKNGDEIPSSWLQYYQANPCVPVDYNSIESALRCATKTFRVEGVRIFQNQQQKSLRILVHPGRYVIDKALNIHAFGSCEITFETLDAPLSNSASYYTDLFEERATNGR